MQRRSEKGKIVRKKSIVPKSGYDRDKSKKNGSYRNESTEDHREKRSFSAGTVKRFQKKKIQKPGSSPKANDGLIRLNKFIANAGICSRREADQLIVAGVIKVNGKIVKELGTKVSINDKVQYDEMTIRPEKPVYVLLNKPKGYITTTDDPFERKTIMSLVRDACKERIYPVGRLDRNTTGLLLLTNDGELAKKLTHPSQRIEKIYHVGLDKVLKKGDMVKIIHGIELEDGFIQADEVAYVEGADDKKQIGIKVHSGKNRIIRRIFEHLGYKISKLDRVVFAGLTKKDLPRGEWRFLKQEEVNRLKMLRK
jgi:23S rRNA pseudouridine2605 synthase